MARVFILLLVFVLITGWLIFWMMLREHERRERLGGKKRTSEPRDPEVRYSVALELDGDLSPSLIKRRYRQQIAKYHPDKVQHLGKEFQTIAERKTREINEAYEFYRRKLDF